MIKRTWKKIKEPFVKHAPWWNNYLTEISVLIISIGATYYGDSLIQSHLEKQEDKEAMAMVRNELISNLKELADIETYYLKEIKFSNALVCDLIRNQTVPEDSVQEFYNQHRLYYYWFLKNNAFDMVRESGTMQRIDKTLLTKLFECYQQLEVVKDMGVRYREERFSWLSEFTINLPDGTHATTVRGQWKQINQNKKFRQYLTVSLPLMAKSALAIEMNATALVQETLQQIDRLYPPGS